MEIKTKDVKSLAKGMIKGIASLHPIGAIIVTALGEIGSSRLEDSMEQLSERIERLEETNIDLLYIKSDEYLDLFIKAMRVRIENRSKQKANMIYALLVESMKKDRNVNFSADEKIRFLNILDKLTNEEISFLNYFLQGKFKNKTQEEIYAMGNSEATGLDGLIFLGLLRIKNSPMTKTSAIPNGVQLGTILKEYVIETKCFENFTKYLEYLTI